MGNDDTFIVGMIVGATLSALLTFGFTCIYKNSSWERYLTKENHAEYVVDSDGSPKFSLKVWKD